MFRKANGKAAASEDSRRTVSGNVESLSVARTPPLGFQHPARAEVVEWQTRTFEGRVAQAVRVQVPPSAPIENA